MSAATDTLKTPETRDSLHGARVAFTGRLASMGRREAHDIVARAGGCPVSGISGRTTHLVIGMHGWPLRDDGDISVKLRQAERLRERHGRIRIISELDFLILAGLRERGPSVRKSFTLDRVAELVGVEDATIQRWEYLGLVRSESGTYDFQDIVSLQAIAALVRRGVRPVEIQKSLASIAMFMPGTDRPLAQLTIVASDAGELLAQVGDSLIAPDGQQLLDFGADAQTDHETDHPLAPPEELIRAIRSPEADAETLFERAVWLEEEERYDEAADLYRRVIALTAPRSEVFFNLGNVLRAQNLDEAAEEMYHLAISVEPSCELAWYNLADVQETAGRVDEAIESLRAAVQIDASFADGHFNLAACLEHVGELDEASAHWRRYLSLDPHSEWAAIARRHLQGSQAGGQSHM